MSSRDNLALATGASTRRASMAFIAALGGLLLVPGRARAGPEERTVRAAESIHDEVEFKAERTRVYAALTQAKQFDQVTSLSEAMRQGGMAPGTAPTEIGAEAGGAFSLFGGYVTGRQVELVPDERIVQAWRAASWHPGHLLHRPVRTRGEGFRDPAHLRPHRVSRRPGGAPGAWMESQLLGAAAEVPRVTRALPSATFMVGLSSPVRRCRAGARSDTAQAR